MAKHLNKSLISGKFKQSDLELHSLKNDLLKGDIKSLSKAITWAESTLIKKRNVVYSLLESLPKSDQKTWRIGISGVPGSGKSTFIERLGQELINQGKKVAVLAVDPSSNYNHGSVLGDKTRMNTLSQAENAFIRPSPSSNHLGGVNNATYESIRLCEASGFDVVIVETVGVGQSETELRDLVDFFLLLKVADTGDELQGIKRGILECCDAIVINKSDLGGGEKAVQIFRNALHVLSRENEFWEPKVLQVSSLKGDEFEQVDLLIKDFFNNKNIDPQRLKLREIQEKQHQKNKFDEELQLLIDNQEMIKQCRLELENGKISLSHAIERLNKLKFY
ncbi:methylmalonyl Co-A mutase-associated GTPase MeaB [Flavobacteriaceae bacterium]|nr:methylmalonyl Co-A mutase-associated GTPase MeaB [Flavobacteriaceae bacterium]